MNHVNIDAFISFAINQGIIQFGQFALKSGRLSPYFFNIGAIHSGKSLEQLGCFYGQRLEAEMRKSNLNFDMILGPAYKGIPIASATAISMYHEFNLDIPYSFNRKEVKPHGEGGQFIGRPPEGRILLVDDVITAGTAVGEIMQMLDTMPKTEVIGLLIAFDREEKSQDLEISATEKLAKKYAIPVYSIITFNNLLNYIETNQSFNPSLIEKMEAYQQQYGTER